jgi:hypothetical protein
MMNKITAMQKMAARKRTNLFFIRNILNRFTAFMSP